MATETWVINENPNASTLPNTSINFTSNEMSFSSIHYFSSEDNPATILYGDTHAWSMGVWINEAFRTVIFETAPTGNLLTWLQANATKQETPTVPKVSVDLTTLAGWEALSSGTHSITVVAKADGYRDSVPSAAVSVEKSPIKFLNECTWAEIAQVSANKQWDAMGWNVGDGKAITLNGTVGTVELNNYQCFVYILGFDHNADREGQGISFGLLQGMYGVQFCLVDGSYHTETSSATAFTMNTSNTNSGGWKNCHMRKTILGSTDVANGDATSAAITNPASGTLMAALPSDLRAVLKPITKYTNNVGQSSAASAITPTVDYLPLLSEYEVFKTTEHANNEATYQAQYQYYASEESALKYKHNDPSYAADWWLRSPDASDPNTFCYVNDGGTIDYYYGANRPLGVAPVFLV